jgi:alpha-amylase/alpha-mannosidase (GH57 family)
LSVRSIVIHGHFYQPPREDPWLNQVVAEPSAAPFHDWNQRIERECYRAVVAARLYAPPPDGRITGIVNTLTSISFDFGPTLLEWLEREAPDTYAAVLEADRQSRVRHDGHGNAIAMPYHHTILPLASRRDKVTEVRWGIADFRRRFNRDPTGLWLPETAVDPETLDVLAAEGIAFTILAPHQVARVPQGGRPGSYRTPSGRSIALFTYDGAISHDVAFGPLLKDAARWAERLLAVGQGERGPRLVAVATDGETFGHHHRFGEVALAWLLRELERQRGVRVENFAAFLARHPPEQDVELVAPTSWSCPHGVERWRADCGCRVAPERPTQQRWRAPLREGLEWLAAELHARFEREGAELLGDPWAARDAYGSVVGSDDASRGRIAAAPARARELLELERNALRMFTSCGWFFDDIAGIEAVQILRYAARAIELAGGDAPRLEAGLLERLARAESNAPGVGSGREVYLERAKRRVPPPAPASAAAAPPADLERELLGAVRSLARDQSPSAITAVLELADRLHGDHGDIPFDVQTVFYRIRAAAPPDRAGPLAPVARRLGFAEGGGG